MSRDCAKCHNQEGAECFWQLPSRGQECGQTSYHVQEQRPPPSPPATTENRLVPNVRRVEIENLGPQHPLHSGQIRWCYRYDVAISIFRHTADSYSSPIMYFQIRLLTRICNFKISARGTLMVI